MSAIDAGLLLAIAVRSAIVLGTLLFAFRVLGKRGTGEMNLSDLLLVLLIANAVQNAMTKGSSHLTVAIASAATLLVVGSVTNRLAVRHRAFGAVLWGEPTVLVESGRLIEQTMRSENISRDELLAAARRHGVESIEKIRLAVLEVDGAISVVPMSASEGGQR